ncbi:MAG: glycerophosphodiester phosphodiesterase family protein [Anaerolineales bacterium]
MFLSLPKPVIIAHRGASSHAPENTLAAFRLAVEQGAAAIELDVQLTADHEVVVFHDISLSRTTDGQGKISDFNLAELEQLNAGVNFEPAYQGERIPTLADVLDNIPDTIFLNIELKNLNTPTDVLPVKTADLIRQFQAQQRVLISSFNPLALYKFQRQIPEVPCGRLLYSKLTIKLYELLPLLASGYQSIHLPFRALTRNIVRTFHERDLKVFAYTLNHPQDIIDAVETGVDGFFTDDPGFASRLLNNEN